MIGAIVSAVSVGWRAIRKGAQIRKAIIECQQAYTAQKAGYARFKVIRDHAKRAMADGKMSIEEAQGLAREMVESMDEMDCMYRETTEAFEAVKDLLP